LPQQWKESISMPINMKGYRTDCSGYRGISLLSTSYNILSNILLSRPHPYVETIIGDNQCGFRRNRSTAHQFFFFSYSPDTREKWEYNETVHQLFVDIEKSYDSVRREVLYNIIIEFELPMKLLGLLKCI
jgi:hypothetical protein